MMQVNLYPGPDAVTGTSSSSGLVSISDTSLALTGTSMVIASSHPHHHNQHQQQHPATKTHGIESMEMDHQVDQVATSASDILSLHRKPLVSNNNEVMFSKEIFTIAQGAAEKPCANHITGRRLIFSQHFDSLLDSAKEYCIKKEFVDVYLQCEDGTLAAHALILSIASPFLKRLLEAEFLGGEANPGKLHEPPVLVLPDVRINLVQSLLELLYTGQVMTLETQFYSLMKLIYDLEINASIDADKTSAQPSKFELTPVLKNNSECDLCRRPRKRSRADTFENTFQSFLYPDNNMLITRGSLDGNPNGNNSNGGGMPWRSTPGGLAVNSLTASGVCVKQEPDEKPSMEEMRDMKRTIIKTGGMNGLSSTVNTMTTNTVNNNQLGHFVAVNSGYQVKMELTGNSGSSCPQQNLSTNPGQQHNSKDSSNSDDPLAAIMNQTIFEGESLNMYIQVPGNGSSPTFVTASPTKPAGKNNQGQNEPQQLEQQQQQQQQQLQQQRSSPQKKGSPAKSSGCQGTTTTSSGEEVQCGTSEPGPGSDQVTSYNCDSCSRVMKGEMLLKAHKFQEHHVNPELENTSIPQNKFPCRVCCKLFTRNSDVKAHILRVHCGDRRYPCTLCGKRFKESTHLRKHLYTHTGERPHFCTHCNKGFQTSSDLKRHKKTRVHQERVDQAEAAGNKDPAASATVPTSGAATATTLVEKTSNSNSLIESASMDTSNMDFDRWTDQDDDLESTLAGNGSGGTTIQVSTGGTVVQASARNSPFATINPLDATHQNTSTAGVILTRGTIHNDIIQSTNSMPIFTTTSPITNTEFIQMTQQPRLVTTTNILLQQQQQQQPIVQQIQFLNEPLQLNSSKPPPWVTHTSSGVILQHQDSSTTASIVGQELIAGLSSSSPLSDVLSSLPNQPLGVHNLTLPSTTLDLSDIKWGILDTTTGVSTIKRSGSMEDAHVQPERIHIREDM